MLRMVNPGSVHQVESPSIKEEFASIFRVEFCLLVGLEAVAKGRHQS